MLEIVFVFVPAMLVFILGVALGSFGNVLVYRYRSGVSLGGRSRCLSCGTTLTPIDLIPLLSYLLSRGRCRHCGSRFSAQYPLVELAAGVLAVIVLSVSRVDLLVAVPSSIGLFFLDLALWEMLLVLAVYDIRHKIIPDGFVIAAALIGILRMIMAFFLLTHGGQEIPLFDMSFAWWWNVFAGPLLALPFALLWFFSGGRWMGLGDAKLALVFGTAFGLAYGLTGIILGFWVGAFSSILLLLFRGRSFTMKSEIPFAPFLVLGMLIVYIFGINIVYWTL